MLFLIAILVAGLFSWFCAGSLKKKPGVFYAMGSILTVLMIILGQMHLQISNVILTYGINLFNKGAIACALWCIVAGMAALPNGSAAIKKLMPIRGELSIFSASITLSHVVTYGIVYLQRLFRNPGSDMNFIATCIVCLLLVCIMIPLTILSFKKIRKKLPAKTWKKIQRLAYVFYALIYLHVMLIYIPRAKMGREGSMFSILVYTIVFAGYAVCRIRKAWIQKKKPESKALLNTVCTAAVILVTAGSWIISRATEKPVVTSKTADSIQTSAVMTDPNTVSETDPVSTASTATTEEITESIPPETETPETSGNTEISETAANTNSSTETVTESSTEMITEKATPDQQENPATESEADPVAEPVQEDPAPELEPEPDPVAEPVQEYPVPEPEPDTEPEIVTIYNNGTFTAEEFGYDSPVSITITIENDVITDITASCNESDMYYFEEAYPVLRNRILESQSTDIDIVAGSTYSSNAILNGVRAALNSARK